MDRGAAFLFRDEDQHTRANFGTCQVQFPEQTCGVFLELLRCGRARFHRFGRDQRDSAGSVGFVVKRFAQKFDVGFVIDGQQCGAVEYEVPPVGRGIPAVHRVAPLDDAP
jgi:hypothetical protein